MTLLKINNAQAVKDGYLFLAITPKIVSEDTETGTKYYNSMTDVIDSENTTGLALVCFDPSNVFYGQSETITWGKINFILNTYRGYNYPSIVLTDDITTIKNIVANKEQPELNNISSLIFKKYGVSTINVTQDLPNDINTNYGSSGNVSVSSVYENYGSPIFFGNITDNDVIDITRSSTTKSARRILKIHGNYNYFLLNFSNVANTNRVNIKYTKASIPVSEQNIAFNLTNCISDYTDTKIKYGDYNIKLTANTGYIFSKNGSITYTDKTGTTQNKEITANNLSSISIPLTVNDNTANINITMSADVKTEPNPEPTPTQTITQNLTHCTSSLKSNVIPQGKQTITFTADNGYKFTTNGSYSYHLTNTGANIDKVIYPTNTDTLTLELNVTKTTANFVITLSASLVENKTSSFSNIYSTNNDELDHLSNERIKNIDENGNTQLFDFGSFISNLYKIPFNIPTDIIGEKEKIVLGNHKTITTTSTKIINNIMNVNIGSIIVPPTYNNSLDYLNTTANLYSPIIQRIQLDINDVIGNTIKINYKINLFTGMCTITVTNNTDVIYLGSQDISTRIPFIQQPNNSITNSNNAPLSNDLTQAYILIDRPKPIITDAYSTNEQGYLKDYKGKTAISDITINDKLTNQEYNLIINQLRQGVIIK